MDFLGWSMLLVFIFGGIAQSFRHNKLLNNLFGGLALFTAIPVVIVIALL